MKATLRNRTVVNIIASIYKIPATTATVELTTSGLSVCLSCGNGVSYTHKLGKV